MLETLLTDNITAMKYSEEKIRALADAAFRRALENRNHLHMYPEISEEETGTAAFISARLKELGIETRENIAGHGVIGTVYGADRTKAVAIRADIDALPVTEVIESPIKSRNPGVMHACGHDMHTAILLGAAQVFKEMEEELPFSIRLIFQPAEETIGGADRMIKEGVLSDLKVESIIALHVEPKYDTGIIEFVPGVMNGAITDFRVTVHGKSCHGAHPDKGTDTIPCACNMVMAYQTLLTRRIDPAHGALITTGTFHSGTKENIISEKTEMTGTIRALETEDMDLLIKEFPLMLESIAKGYGCTVDIRLEQSFPNLVNDDSVLDPLKDAFTELAGPEKIIVNPVPSLGGDDFAYFGHMAPSCFYNIGCHRPGDPHTFGLHAEDFDPDENCMLTGILTEVFGVLKLMEYPF